MPLLPLLALASITLRNGDMEAEASLPFSWDGKWVGRGSVEASRDMAERHGGAASLKVVSRGDSQGQVSQMLDAPGGSTVTLSGWVKTAGAAKAVLAVQPFSGDWAKNEFHVVGAASGSADWQRFSGTVTLPAWASRFGVALLVEGDGQAWLDDVTLDGKDVAPDDGTVPPDAQEPTVPYPGYWKDYPQAWGQTFEGLKGEAARARAEGKRLVFLGDSITQGWKEDTGRPVFNREFAPLGAVNLGIGGDRTNQLLYRLDHGQFDGLDPKLVVLNIGVNNFWAGDFSPEKIADGVSAVIARIQKAAPNARILNVGILPTQGASDNPLRAKARAINAILAGRADGRRVVFLDVTKAFLSSDGTLSREIMPDLLHPNTKGYELYAIAIAPKVRAMLAGR